MHHGGHLLGLRHVALVDVRLAALPVELPLRGFRRVAVVAVYAGDPRMVLGESPANRLPDALGPSRHQGDLILENSHDGTPWPMRPTSLLFSLTSLTRSTAPWVVKFPAG